MGLNYSYKKVKMIRRQREVAREKRAELTTYVTKHEGTVTTGKLLIQHRLERHRIGSKTVVSTGIVFHF